MKRKLLVILLLVQVLFFLTAQVTPPQIGVKAQYMKKVLRLRIAVPKGHYTYKRSPYASALQLFVKDGKLSRRLQIELPAGKKKADEIILDKDFWLNIAWKKLSSLAGKRRYIKIIVAYQLCSAADGVCYPPVRKVLNVKMPIQNNKNAQNGSTKIVKKPVTIDRAKSDAASLSLGEKLQRLLKKNLSNPLAAFFLALLGGLLASLTPCVYPIIPVTVGYFAKNGAATRRSRLGKAIAYVLGMGVVYTLLGVIAGLAGSAFGSLTNRPGFFVAVGILFFFLSLSLFELFELRMPGFMQKIAPGSGTSGKGSAFLMGAAAGLVASPCVGPIIFFLLTNVLQAGKPLYGALLMAGFSLGMGVLFLFLAFFSQSIAHLPRSGNWMVRVKIVFGALVLGSAFYFFLLAAHGLGISVLAQRVVVALLTLLAIVTGFRKLNTLYGSRSGHGVLLAVVLSAVLLFTQLNISGKKLNWGNDYQAAIREAKKRNKPIFMDLYAEWCSICKEVEKALLARPKLLADLTARYIPLKIDYDKHKLFLEKKFGVKSLPWILILSPEGKVLWKRVGFNDAKAFMQELKKVLPKYSGQKGARR